MKVSIIIAAYNIEQYIKRCISSVINQTERDIEIIIVNDGSTDNTLNIIENVTKNDSRIKVINKKNEGLIEARKTGLSIAKGEYILFVDGDDYLELGAIEKLYNYSKVKNLDVLLFNCFWSYDDGRIVCKNTFDKNEIKNNDSYIKLLLLGKMSVNIWSKFIKREFILKVNLPNNLTYGEDLAIVMSMLTKKPNISYIEDNLYYYYQREDAITKKIDTKVLGLEEAIEYAKSILENNNMFLKYKSEFEYFYYINMYLTKIVFNTDFNNIHKKLYDYYREKNINLFNNMYIKNDLKNRELFIRFKIILFNINYSFVKIYKNFRYLILKIKEIKNYRLISN